MEPVKNLDDKDLDDLVACEECGAMFEAVDAVVTCILDGSGHSKEEECDNLQVYCSDCLDEYGFCPSCNSSISQEDRKMIFKELTELAR